MCCFQERKRNKIKRKNNISRKRSKENEQTSKQNEIQLKLYQVSLRTRTLQSGRDCAGLLGEGPAALILRLTCPSGDMPLGCTGWQGLL